MSPVLYDVVLQIFNVIRRALVDSAGGDAVEVRETSFVVTILIFSLPKVLFLFRMFDFKDVSLEFVHPVSQSKSCVCSDSDHPFVFKYSLRKNRLTVTFFVQKYNQFGVLQ